MLVVQLILVIVGLGISCTTSPKSPKLRVGYQRDTYRVRYQGVWSRKAGNGEEEKQKEELLPLPPLPPLPPTGWLGLYLMMMAAMIAIAGAA